MSTATFVTTDITTQGSWIGVYGADGYEFPISLADSPPGYLATFDIQDSSFNPAATFEWGHGVEVRRLQNPSDPTGDRYAITWYAVSYIFLNVGATSRRVAVYCLDDDGTDNGGAAGRREQTFDVRDVDNSLALLDSQIVGNFEAGKWMVWDITGSVRIDVIKTGAQNAVIAAVMFNTPTVGSAPNPYYFRHLVAGASNV